MADLGLALIVGIPLVWHVLLAGFAYVDAPNYGMDPVRWGVVSLLVPFFGFFAYLFERGERVPGPDESMFAEGPFEVHESRADDVAFTQPNEPSVEDETSSRAVDHSGSEDGDGEVSEH